MSETSYGVVAADAVAGWDASADVVVVGLGCAGVCAAIEARAAGADVLVLERASGGGGITANAAGHIYLGGGTRVQKAVGVEDSIDAMFTYLMMNTPEPDEAKIRLYCEESVQLFDWLVAQGVPFKDTMYQGKHVMQMTDECLIWSGNEEVYPFREKAKPAPRGHKVAKAGEGGGGRMMECLIARAEALGVRIVCDAAVQQLVVENGRVVGVRYRHFDADKAVAAGKGVVLATGQFTKNREMLERYCPALLDPRLELQFTPNDDGAGIQLGEAAGGVPIHMDGALITNPFYPPEQLLKGVLVNREGRRYVAEDSYHSRSSIFTRQQPGGVAYLIVDDEIFARPDYGGYEVVDVFESFEDMERGLDMPAGALVETLTRHNEFAARGEDPDFHKGAKWLRPLSTPPYAALDASIACGRWMSFTLGGLDVSLDGEVLRADASPVAGLYAAGGCASNIAQDGTGYSSGTCIGESVFFGRRAGLHAAGAAG